MTKHADNPHRYGAGTRLSEVYTHGRNGLPCPTHASAKTSKSYAAWKRGHDEYVKANRQPKEGPKMNTREYWENLMRASVRGLTPEQEKLAVDRCILTMLDGEPCGTWHAAAMVAGRVCCCANCKGE